MNRHLVTGWAVLVGVWGAVGLATESGGGAFLPVQGAVIVGFAAALAVTRAPWAAFALAAAALATFYSGGEATQTVAVFWVSVALGMFSGRDLGRALRAIAVTIYAFAGVNKLISPAYMSGWTLAQQMDFPALRLLACVVAATELLLAVTILRRDRRLAVPLICMFHLPAAVVVGDDVGHVVVLAGYGAMMLWMTWWSVELVGSRRPAQTPAVGEVLADGVGVVGGVGRPGV